MYTVEEVGSLVRVTVVCDTKRKGHVHTSADITTSSRGLSIGLLYALGWRLHRGKQLCPECAAKVAKKLERAG